MKIRDEHPRVDAILERYRDDLRGDFTAYRNHLFRVQNLCHAIAPMTDEEAYKVAIANAFHDLGIWSDHTWDYLDPSAARAKTYLEEEGLADWFPEVEAIIVHHHKVTKYTGDYKKLVEPFRIADWIDVTRGMLRFGVDMADIRELYRRFPPAGFHTRLVQFTLKRLTTKPWSPLPMFKW